MCGSFLLLYFKFCDSFITQPLMNQYFERIQQLLVRSDFPVRIRFMIEDVIDLRNAKVNMNAWNRKLHDVTEYYMLSNHSLRHFLLVYNSDLLCGRQLWYHPHRLLEVDFCPKLPVNSILHWYKFISLHVNLIAVLMMALSFTYDLFILEIHVHVRVCLCRTKYERKLN